MLKETSTLRKLLVGAWPKTKSSNCIPWGIEKHLLIIVHIKTQISTVDIGPLEIYLIGQSHHNTQYLNGRTNQAHCTVLNKAWLDADWDASFDFSVHCTKIEFIIWAAPVVIITIPIFAMFFISISTGWSKNQFIEE